MRNNTPSYYELRSKQNDTIQHNRYRVATATNTLRLAVYMQYPDIGAEDAASIQTIEPNMVANTATHVAEMVGQHDWLSERERLIAERQKAIEDIQNESHS